MGAADSKGLKNRQDISLVSKRLRISKRDLKEFESEGVFDYADKLKKTIDEKNYERLKIAVSLKKEMGVNLEGIDVILHMRDKLARMRQDMNKFLKEVRTKLQGELRKKTDELEEKMKR